tara:strand:- start:1583 stop:1723 length:141 start_codon:yes stop_codon:yes gene_type:complete
MVKESLEHEVVSKGVFRGRLSMEKSPFFDKLAGQMRIDDCRNISRI